MRFSRNIVRCVDVVSCVGRARESGMRVGGARIVGNDFANELDRYWWGYWWWFSWFWGCGLGNLGREISK